MTACWPARPCRRAAPQPGGRNPAPGSYPGEPGNDHLIFSEGPRLPAAVRDVQGRRGDLRAAGELAADRITARVSDLYSVKPVDQAALADAAAAAGGRLVIAEDHYPQGGLGAAVLEALAGAGLPLRVRQCAVSSLRGSGTPDELMEAAGISAARIAAAARELLKN